MHHFKTDVLVVGGGTGATAAALQAARRGLPLGIQVTLVSEGPWLGGMLTRSGVTVPDGNELAAFQTGIWGQFLQQLQQRQRGGLDQSWVSCFCYEPQIGAEIFADWVAELPNLKWIAEQQAIAVHSSGERFGDASGSATAEPVPASDSLSRKQLTAVQFPDYSIEAKIILDGTELGDLLALGDVSHCWGWEPQELWQEPSAPTQAQLETDPFFTRYPVQSPTWVVYLQDYGADAEAPLIPVSDEPSFWDKDLAVLGVEDDVDPERAFVGAWEQYGGDRFLDYGRLPGDRFMLNWPIHGNDYGWGLERLVSGPQVWKDWAQEAIAYSQGFARYIQQKLGRRYGLATDAFPVSPSGLGGGAYALQPYYREGRRLKGLVTIIEQDILPQPDGVVAALPTNEQGKVTSIAIGNYPNDHHYPTREIPLAPKARRWGGRWTGTPFTIPYGALVSESVDGLLACEKNISVSHMANGATRLQPTVLGMGQAAGMAAALCIELDCQPRDLPVRKLQDALLSDPQAPSAVVPFYDLLPEHPDWRSLQQYCLDYPKDYPISGERPERKLPPLSAERSWPFEHLGQVLQADEAGYRMEHPDYPEGLPFITLRPEVERGMRSLQVGQSVAIAGYLNPSGPWARVEFLVLR